MQSLLQGMQQSGVPDMADLPPPAARQVYSRIMAAAAEPVRAVHIADRTIAGPGGDLALRIYAPRRPDPRRGIALYLHGGGFVVGSPRDYDSVASALCVSAAAVSWCRSITGWRRSIPFRPPWRTPGRRPAG